MNKNIINKSIVFVLCILGIALASCSDWTDVKGLEIDQAKKEGHAKYQEYLEALRAYRKLDHKVVYAWFDNTVKQPKSRAEHIQDVPDSIDYVVLTDKNKLVEREIEEIASIRANKGMKVLYAITSSEDLRRAYEAIVKEHEEENVGNDDPTELISQSEYIMEQLNKEFALINKDHYDGIVVNYFGKSTAHITEEQIEIYKELQEAFLNTIFEKYATDKNFIISFEGTPQYLFDKTLLDRCKHILVSSTGVTNISELMLSVNVVRAEGVPVDRFVVSAITTTVDDPKIGVWMNGDKALKGTAEWVVSEHAEYTVSGLAIHNLTRDYYNPKKTYSHSREAIDIMNPSINK